MSTAATSCATSTAATSTPRVAQIETDAQELLTQIILTKGFPAGLRRVREHRALGHRTILITGALDFAVEGLRPLFDEIIAAEMSVRPDGTLSGEMLQVPPTGETRAQILDDYCRAEGLRIDEAVAYADSTSDLPLLEAVGFPVAVNPETRLAAIARKRGWLVEHWAKASGGPRPLLPIGPLMVERERRRSVPMTTSIRVFRVHRSAGRRSRARATLRWPPDTRMEASREGAAGEAVDGRGWGWPGWRRRWRRRRRCGSGRWSTPTSTRPSCPGRAGTASAPGWPGSAAPTCR